MKTVKMGESNFLIKQTEAETKTASGIIIPDSAKEKPLQGEIVKVPKGEKDFLVGETAIFTKYSGTPVVVAGINYIVVNKEQILLTL